MCKILAVKQSVTEPSKTLPVVVPAEKKLINLLSKTFSR